MTFPGHHQQETNHGSVPPMKTLPARTPLAAKDQKRQHQSAADLTTCLGRQGRQLEAMSLWSITDMPKTTSSGPMIAFHLRGPWAGTHRRSSRHNELHRGFNDRVQLKSGEINLQLAGKSNIQKARGASIPDWSSERHSQCPLLLQSASCPSRQEPIASGRSWIQTSS